MGHKGDRVGEWDGGVEYYYYALLVDNNKCI